MSKSTDQSVELWFMCCVYHLVIAPITYNIVKEFMDGNTKAILATIFTLAGLWLIWYCFLSTLRLIKFGRSLLILNPYPPSTNGVVAGKIHITIPFKITRNFEVKLWCFKETTREYSGKFETQTTVEWSTLAVANQSSGPLGTDLDFCFVLPKGLKPTKQVSDVENYYWDLCVNCLLSGFDFSSSFPIKIKSTTTQTLYTGEKHLRLTAEDMKQKFVDSSNSGSSVRLMKSRLFELLKFKRISNGLKIQSRLFRKYKVSLFIPIVFAIYFVPAGLMAMREGLHTVSAGALIVGISCLCVAVFRLFNSFEVTVSPTEINKKWKLFGLPFYKATITKSNIRDVFVDNGWTTSENWESQGSSNRYFFVKLRLANGKLTNVSIGLPERLMAEYQRRLIKKMIRKTVI